MATRKKSTRREQLESTLAELEAELAALPPDPPTAALAYMTVPQYAAYLQVSTRTVQRLLTDGLPIVRPRPRLIRIPVIVADAWMTARSRSATVAAVRGAIQ